MGFEYVSDPDDSAHGLNLYDFTQNVWFYASPANFPYIYNFTEGDWWWYEPNPNDPTHHYTSNPRWFYDFGNGTVQPHWVQS